MASLWPTMQPGPTRTMADMLREFAGDLSTVTNNKLDFYVDTMGIADPPMGPPTKVRHNCYVKDHDGKFAHLFFQVTTPSSGPFPARIGTPEGDLHHPTNEEELRTAIEAILSRPRTSEVINDLIGLT